MFNDPDNFKVIDGVLWVNDLTITHFHYVPWDHSPIRDISALALCPHLTSVEVKLEANTDLSPLRELRALRKTYLYAEAFDFEPLRNHPAIEDFCTTAVGECVSWLDIIATFPRLKHLHVARRWPRSSKIFQAQPFVDHPYLESLILMGVDVYDPEKILKIPNLSYFRHDQRIVERKNLDEWVNDELKKRKASCA